MQWEFTFSTVIRFEKQTPIWAFIDTDWPHNSSMILSITCYWSVRGGVSVYILIWGILAQTLHPTPYIHHASIKPQSEKRTRTIRIQ